MKRIVLFVILTFAFSTVFTGCKSKEDQAAELIKNELFKTLYDFDSYQPIETIVTEAKETPINNCWCWIDAKILWESLDRISEYLGYVNFYKDMYEEYRKDWFFSKYADEKKESYYEYVSKYNTSVEDCNKFANEILDSIAKFDEGKTIGWNVEHSFRCKTKGGQYSIAHYRYVISKDFKTIILREDKDDEDDKRTRHTIENLADWSELQIVDDSI